MENIIDYLYVKESTGFKSEYEIRFKLMTEYIKAYISIEAHCMTEEMCNNAYWLADKTIDIFMKREKERLEELNKTI